MSEFSIICEVTNGSISCRQYSNSEVSFIVFETLDIEGNSTNPTFTNNYWVYCGILSPEEPLLEMFLNEFREGFQSSMGRVRQSKPYFKKYISHVGKSYEWEHWTAIDGLSQNIYEFVVHTSKNLNELYDNPFYKLFIYIRNSLAKR